MAYFPYYFCDDSVLGRQHLTLSFFSSIIVAGPLLRVDQVLFFVVVLGVCIGSLIPDIDAEDAAIFHFNVRGLKGDTGRILNDFVAPILPIFGYMTKYVIYRPLLFVFDKILFRKLSFSDKHRTFTHSVLGVTAITVVTGLLIGASSYLLGLFDPVIFSLFLVAYASGCFLHMLQDSCTRTGIAWNSPFSSKKLKGDIYTGKDFLKIHLFALVLGSMAFISLFVSLTGFTGLGVHRLFLTAFSSLLSIWMLFLVFVGVKVVKKKANFFNTEH